MGSPRAFVWREASYSLQLVIPFLMDLSHTLPQQQMSIRYERHATHFFSCSNCGAESPLVGIANILKDWHTDWLECVNCDKISQRQGLTKFTQYASPIVVITESMVDLPLKRNACTSPKSLTYNLSRNFPNLHLVGCLLCH